MIDVDKAYRWLKSKEEDYRNWQQAMEVLTLLASSKGEFAKLDAQKKDFDAQLVAVKEKIAAAEAEALAAEAKRDSRKAGVDKEIAAYKDSGYKALEGLKRDTADATAKSQMAKASYEKMVAEREAKVKALDGQILSQSKVLSDIQTSMASIREAVN
jgi:septal ring factor EnvC (AmiA/AmiB activator)